MFFLKNRLKIASLRIGKHRIVKNIAWLRKVNIAHPYMDWASIMAVQMSSRAVPLMATPVYKATILVTEKHRADFNFFGHFLPRLSRNDHSQVISMATFCWGHST